MKRPDYRRQKPHRLDRTHSAEQLGAWAALAVYVGSPEHKDFPTFAGAPKLRSDATRCPRSITDQNMVTSWLKEAILAGNVSGLISPDVFPRYAWGFHQGRWFEARIVNGAVGTYKAYPVGEREVPFDLLD